MVVAPVRPTAPTGAVVVGELPWAPDFVQAEPDTEAPGHMLALGHCLATQQALDGEARAYRVRC